MKTVQKIVISVCVMLTVQAQAEVGPHNATSLMGPEIQTAQHGRQVSFVSPDAAINSLVDAIRQGNQIKMRRVLGEQQFQLYISVIAFLITCRTNIFYVPLTKNILLSSLVWIRGFFSLVTRSGHCHFH